MLAGLDIHLPTLAAWLAGIGVAGIAGGILAGLLGVGSGIVIVPVLYHLLDVMGVDSSVRMKVAVATSLSTIVATSAVSLSSHRKRNAIDGALLRSWGVPIFLGVVAGTVLGGYADGYVLTVIFAVVAFAVAMHMLLRRDGAKLADGFPNATVKAVSGFFVGAVSALMGIGGGTLSVPILSAFGFDIRRAVGTASAIGFIIAIPGTLGYIYAGLGAPGLPPNSLGYVNVLAALILVPLTMSTAPLGARMAHAIPRQTLQLCFALFLLITSARMFYDLF